MLHEQVQPTVDGSGQIDDGNRILVCRMDDSAVGSITCVQYQ